VSYGRELLTPGSTWRHVRTDSTYTVFGLALCSTNGEREHREESVVYASHTHGHLCYREVGEFLDGRFRPLHAPGPEADPMRRSASVEEVIGDDR
jgi:predicted SAM-dependent methyltransferase